VDAHRRRGLDFYGQILLWPHRYVHYWAVQAWWLGCTNVGGTLAVGVHPPHPVVASWTHTAGVVWTFMARYSMATQIRARMGSASVVVGMHKCWGDPRRRFAPSTPGGRVGDAHRRRGLDFYGQILIWPPNSAHEWAGQAPRLGCTNVGGTPAVGLHPPHPVVVSWTHTAGVVWTFMARYFYGHPDTCTNGKCKRRGWDAQMLRGGPPSHCTLHARWSRRGRTP